MSTGGKWDRRQTRKTTLTHVSSRLKQTVIAFSGTLSSLKEERRKEERREMMWLMEKKGLEAKNLHSSLNSVIFYIQKLTSLGFPSLT